MYTDPGFPEFILTVAAGLIVGLAIHRHMERRARNKKVRLERERLAHIAEKQTNNLYLWLRKDEE